MADGTISKVHEARQSVYRSFKTKWTQMDENSRFVRLDQYSKNQLEKMSKQNRVPYVLDYLNSSMNTFQGIQRDRRTEIFYFPQGKEDEVKVEVLNSVKDASLHENDFVYLESDVFRDGLIEKVGLVGYEWSREKNKNGSLRIFRIPPRQGMWDLNGQDPTGKECTWMSYHRWLGKRELMNRYPEDAKKIQRMPFFSGDETVDATVYSKDYLTSVVDNELDAVALIEFFERSYETRYFLRMGGYIYPTYYDTEKAAVQAGRENLEKLAAKFTDAGQIPPAPETIRIITDKFPLIKKSCIAHDTVFEKEKVIEEPFYPLSKYHPFFHDGDYWCPLDIQKDAQRFHNKMFSMADHWIGSMSKGLLLADSKADKDEVKQVTDKFSSTGGVVQVKDIQNYQLFESKGPAPQLFSMLDMAKQNLDENSGGRNFMGKKETASESGIAVRQRIEQGGLAGFVIYDNHRRWKMDVGEKVSWYLTHYMTYPTTVRILGEDLVQETMQKSQSSGTNWFKKSDTRPGVGYMEINTEEHNTLEGIKVDVLVDEARWSVSRNQSILQEMSAAMQSNPLLAKTFPPEVVLEYLNLPFSEKEKARKRMAELEQQQMQLEMMKAQKPPSVSLALGDVKDIPPEAAAQVLAKYFGIQVDPSQIQDKDAQKAQIETMKGMMELKMKAQEGELTLQQKSQEMQMKEAEFAQQMEHGALAGEQKLGFAERQQQLKEKSNGKKE